MNGPFFNAGNFAMEVVGKAGKTRKKGRQDISRTLNSPKAAVFQRFGAGASVGARAARKEKVSKFKRWNGTIGLFGRKAPLP